MKAFCVILIQIHAAANMKRALLFIFNIAVCYCDFDQVGDNRYYIGIPDKSIRGFDWFDARRDCRDHDAKLVSIDSSEEFMNLQNYILSKDYTNGTTFSTSGHHFHYHNIFAWDDSGDIVNCSKWLPGAPKEPEEQNGGYLKLVVYNRQLYLSRSYGYDQFYICEELSWWRKLLRLDYLLILLVCMCSALWAYLNWSLGILQRRNSKMLDEKPLIK